MIALTRILVPTNLGEPSKAAIRYGVAFARQFHARLYLLHVLSDQDFDLAVEAERVMEHLAPDVAEPPEDSTPEAVVRTVARADLRRLLDPADEQAARAEYLIRPEGAIGPHAAIVACARDLQVELIVMGKHGIGRVEHLLGGSVTERVVRQAPCPVMVVQHPQHQFVLPDDVTAVVEY